MITMLAEKLIKIPDSSFIQINTDGLTLRIPRKYESEYMKICEEWSKITRLELEHAYYKKMVIWDVNNYIAEYTDGKVKCKGRAEYENIPLHKNKSFSIIPRAVHDYFIKGIPVEDTIKSSTNIYEFCAGVKSSYNEKSGRSHYEIWSVNNGNFVKEKLSKIVRYFISKKGGTLLKIYERGGEEQVNAPYKDGKFQKDWRVTYFNKAYFPENFEDYNIDHLYYIHQAKTWINQIKNDKKEYIISLF